MKSRLQIVWFAISLAAVMALGTIAVSLWRIAGIMQRNDYTIHIRKPTNTEGVFEDIAP